jgi:hypothetical protein
MSEIYNKTKETGEVDRDLKEIERKSHERARNILERERSSEQNRETSEQIRNEALELAKNQKTESLRSSEHTKDLAEARHNHIASKIERRKAYNNIMSVAQAQMSTPARTFSKIIHNPVVEKTSEVVGATIVRPNAVLAGSVSALILVLGVYIIAHFFGYPLSGFETIGAFLLGWLIGIIYDFFYAMITGKVS